MAILRVNKFDYEAISNGTKVSHTVVLNPQPLNNVEKDGAFYSGDYKVMIRVDGHPEWREQLIWEYAKYLKGDTVIIKNGLDAPISVKITDVKFCQVKEVDESQPLREGYTEDAYWENFKSIVGYPLATYQEMKEEFVGETCAAEEEDPMNWYYWKIDKRNNNDNQDSWVFIYDFDVNNKGN